MKVSIGVLVVCWLSWLALAIVLGFRIGSDGLDFNSIPCAIPNSDSQYGNGTWSWWPPGEICRTDDGRVFKTPASWRSNATLLLGVGFVVLPIATVILARRDREGAEDNSLGLDELVG